MKHLFRRIFRVDLLAAIVVQLNGVIEYHGKNIWNFDACKLICFHTSHVDRIYFLQLLFCSYLCFKKLFKKSTALKYFEIKSASNNRRYGFFFSQNVQKKDLVLSKKFDFIFFPPRLTLSEFMGKPRNGHLL